MAPATQRCAGRRLDYVGIYELDDRRRKPRSVDDDFLADVRDGVRDAAEALRRGALAPVCRPQAGSAGEDRVGTGR